MSRNPTLTSSLPEQLKASRAKCMANQDIISHWFNLVKETLETNDLLNKPHLICNVDESGFPTDPSRIRVLCEKNISHLFRIIGGSGRESITVNGCASADGRIMPPYILYPGKNLWDIWNQNGPDGARYTVSEKGWMNSERFLDWFELHFIPNLPSERPVVLLFDGHASYMNRRLFLKARENEVILLKLPSNSTNLLQPLDVGLYGPVKTTWEKILIKFARQNLGTAMTKELFPTVLKELWTSDCMSVENVKAGFKRWGIYPFDPTALPSSMYEAANIFDKADPSTWVSVEAPPSASTAFSFSSPPALSASATNPSTSATMTAPETSPSSALTGSAPATHTPSAHPSPSTTSTATRVPLSPRKSIKDFFLKRISPMLAKKSESSERKMVKCLYGESLTSDDCMARVQEEEEKKKKLKTQPKRKGKGKTTFQKKENDENYFESETEIDDNDNDHDRVPPRKHDRNIFETDL